MLGCCVGRGLTEPSNDGPLCAGCGCAAAVVLRRALRPELWLKTGLDMRSRTLSAWTVPLSPARLLFSAPFMPAAVTAADSVRLVRNCDDSCPTPTVVGRVDALAARDESSDRPSSPLRKQLEPHRCVRIGKTVGRHARLEVRDRRRCPSGRGCIVTFVEVQYRRRCADASMPWSERSGPA